MGWAAPYDFLEQTKDALQIPIGSYNRTKSGEKGSIVLNQTTQDELFDQKIVLTC